MGRYNDLHGQHLPQCLTALGYLGKPRDGVLEAPRKGRNQFGGCQVDIAVIGGSCQQQGMERTFRGSTWSVGASNPPCSCGGVGGFER